MHYRYLCGFFALTLFIPSLLVAQRTPPTVAVVNGTSIPYSRYEQLREDYRNAMKQGGSASVSIDQATDDNFFLQVVDAELLQQESAKRGVKVSRADAVRALLAEPPEFMKGPFIDENGVFQKEVFRDVVTNPERITRLVSGGTNQRQLVAQWKDDLEKVIEFVRLNELQRKITDRLYAEKPLTENQIRDRYFADAMIVNGSFVRILHSTIADSLVPVTDAEVEAYYRKHRDEYNFTPGRSIGANIFPIIPTREDTLVHRARVDSARSLLNATPLATRQVRVNELLRTLPPNRFPADQPIPISQIPEYMRAEIAQAKQGDLVGPIYYERDGVLLFVERRIPSRDTTLRVRHLLLRVEADNVESDSINQSLAAALAENIKTEETFKEAAKIYGQDGTRAVEGDLGYINRGQTVPEFERAAYAGKPGEVIGPVKTPFGYHLIWVTEKITENFLLRELRFPVAPSAVARDAVMKDARLLARTLFDGKPADSLLAALRVKYPGMVSDTSLIERLDPYGDLLVSGEFAFSAQPGEVATLRLPFDRIAVFQLLQIRPGGIPELAMFPNYVAAHVRREKQLALLEPKVKLLADSLTADMLIGPIRRIAPQAEIFLFNDQKIDSPPEENPLILDSLLRVTPAGGVGGPVRGKHAYYFLRLIDKKGPSEGEYQKQKENFRTTYLAKYREELYNQMILKARHYGEIKDLRPSTQALITGQ